MLRGIHKASSTWLGKAIMGLIMGGLIVSSLPAASWTVRGPRRRYRRPLLIWRSAVTVRGETTFVTLPGVVRIREGLGGWLGSGWGTRSGCAGLSKFPV